MKMTLHKILFTAFLLITITLAQKTFANAAQPGIWNAGGTVYTMLYPEDAITFKKVQMQQERIFIQLYKGFAVVKGPMFLKIQRMNIYNSKWAILLMEFILVEKTI